MLKKLNADILIGLLIASLFWVGIFVWQSSQPPNHTSAASQHCEGTKSECAKATTDERIADYTWWLAVLTAGLVCAGVVQFGFLIRSDNTARIAANAADLSARAAVGQKLPILRCSTPHLWPASTVFQDAFVGTGDPTKHDFIKIIGLELFNHGETLAYPREYGLGWMLTEKKPAEKEALVAEPVYTDIHDLSHELVIKDGFHTPRIVTFCLAPDAETKGENQKLDDYPAALRIHQICRFPGSIP